MHSCLDELEVHLFDFTAELIVLLAAELAPTAGGHPDLQIVELELQLLDFVARCVVGAGCQPGNAEAASATFEIHLEPGEGDPGDIEYVPTNLDGCAERLPEYMQDAIICAPRRLRWPSCMLALRALRARHVHTCLTSTRLTRPPSPSCATRRAVEGSQAPALFRKMLQAVADE